MAAAITMDLVTKAENSGKAEIDAAPTMQRPAVQGMVRQMLDVAEPPDEVTIAFGLDLRADVGGVIAAAGSSANFTVELTWRRPPGERPAGSA